MSYYRAKWAFMNEGLKFQWTDMAERNGRQEKRHLMNPRQVLKNSPVIISQTVAKRLLEGVRRLKADSVRDLANEIISARLQFPKNAHMQAALVEEVGELAQAYLKGEPIEAIRKEALQVACVAMRIYEEGDADFGDER